MRYEGFYYGAGSFYDDWREQISDACGIRIWDPRSNNQDATFHFVRGDFATISHPDCLGVIALIPPPPTRCSGTAAEIGYAVAVGKRILLIVEDPVPDAFLLGCAKRVFFGVDAFITWFKDRQAKGLSIL